MSSPESPTIVKGARRSLLLAKAARRSGRGGGRSRILQEALRLFASHDYSDVSMSDVAREAGVTKAALYYHYRDKNELYYQAVLLGIDQTRQAMSKALAEGGTLEERLIRATTVGFERMQAEVLNLHLHSHQHLTEERHAEIHRAMDQIGEPVVEALTAATPAGSAISPRAAAALLGATGMALLFTAAGPLDQSDDLPRDKTERAALVVRLFLHGYLGLAGVPDDAAG